MWWPSWIIDIVHHFGRGPPKKNLDTPMTHSKSLTPHTPHLVCLREDKDRTILPHKQKTEETKKNDGGKGLCVLVAGVSASGIMNRYIMTGRGI